MRRRSLKLSGVLPSQAYTPMGTQASTPAYALPVEGTGLLPLQNVALSAPPQAFLRSKSKAIMLFMAAHQRTSTSRCRSRVRVRPRAECTTATPRRTLLYPVGVGRDVVSPVETRLESAVMAGDENMMTKREAATSIAWGLGPSRSTSRGDKNDGRDNRHRQQHTQRAGDKEDAGNESSAEESSNDGAAYADAAAGAAAAHKLNGAPRAAVAGGQRGRASEGTASSRSTKANAGDAADAALVAIRQKAFLKRVVALGRRGRPTEVLGLMENVKREGFPPCNIYMYNACITALGRCGRWRQALAILDHMRYTANAVDAAAAAAALKANAAARLDGVALKSPPVPPVVRPDVISYSAAITALGKAGEWQRALALLRVMRAQGVPPNVVSYNAAAHACVGDRRQNREMGRMNCNGVAEPPEQGQESWALVIGLMAEMRAEGVAPDVFTFTIAITACGKAGQWERALGLLEEMGGEQQQVDDEFQRPRLAIAPDAVAINAAISACARAGQWEKALELLGRMAAPAGGGLVGSIGASCNAEHNGKESTCSGSVSSAAPASSSITRDGDSNSSDDVGRGERAAKSGPAWPVADSVSFNSAMEACAIAGRWQEGIALLPRMREAGVRPDVCSYGAHLACLRAGGQWQRAIEVLDEMAAGVEGGGGRRTASVSPDLGCYAAVMSTLGEAGRWAQALDLLRFLQKKGSSGVSVSAGAASRDAERLAAEARKGHAAISSSPTAGPNLVCYNAALAACARAREGVAALGLLEEMEGRGVFDTASFNSAILACRGKGLWRNAIALLGRMIKGEAVRLWEGEGGNGDSKGRGAGAGGTIQRTTVPRPDAYSFASAITACGDAGQADVAVKLLRKMKSAGVEPSVVVFNAGIRAVSRGMNGAANDGLEREDVTDVGEVRPGAGGARAEYKAEESGRDRGVREGGGKGGNSWRRAYSLMEEMREAGLVPEVKSYNTVLAVCQRAEAWKGALDILEQMKRGKARRLVRSRWHRQDAAGAAVDSWVEEPAPPPDLVSFNTAMGACGKAGEWEEALRLLEELSDFGFSPNAISYNTAAAACARAKKWERAQEIIDRGRNAGVIAELRGETGEGEAISVPSGDVGRFYAAVEDMLRRQRRSRKHSGGGKPWGNFEGFQET